MGIARDFQLHGHQRLGILWEKRRGALQSHHEAVNRQGWEVWVWLRQAREKCQGFKSPGSNVLGELASGLTEVPGLCLHWYHFPRL